MKLGMTRAEMLSKMSSRELSEWMAFSTIEPFGSQADLLGHAITSQTIANRHRNKNEKTHSVEEFMPVFGKNVIEDEEELMNFVLMTTLQHGGKDNRGSS